VLKLLSCGYCEENSKQYGISYSESIWQQNVFLVRCYPLSQLGRRTRKDENIQTKWTSSSSLWIKKQFWPLKYFFTFNYFYYLITNNHAVRDNISYGNDIYTLFPTTLIEYWFAMLMPHAPFFQCAFLCNFPFSCYLAGIICFTHTHLQ